MKQSTREARQDYFSIMEDIPTRVSIIGTKRTVRLRWIKPYTMERLTRLWVEREASIPSTAAETLRSLCREPYFAVKEAAILTINNFWGLHLIYPFKWRIWAYLRGYTEAQMHPIIMEGKKKLPLMAHWQNMAFSVDMRTDWVKMTDKEAEQYRAELLSVASQPSSKNSPATEDTDSE